MTTYSVKVDGKVLRELSAEDVETLYGTGHIHRHTSCKHSTHAGWRSIDEFFPLLKHQSAHREPASQDMMPLENSWERQPPRPPKNSAVLAGWICFGLGLAIAWFFPLANVFFSVAIILSIVAMCTHQVGKGLALLLSSFVGIGVCTLIFMLLVVGTVGAAVKTAQTKASRFDSTVRQQIPAPPAPQTFVAPNAQNTRVPPQTLTFPTPTPRDAYRQPAQRPAPAKATPAPYKPPTLEQQAARQRRYDAAMQAYKTKDEMLGRAILSKGDEIRRARNSGSSQLATYYEKQRESYRKQRAALKPPTY